MFGRYEASPALKRRLRISAACGLMLLMILFARLWVLQVLQGEEPPQCFGREIASAPVA